MTFPSDSPFYEKKADEDSRPEHTHPPLAYRTPIPNDETAVPRVRLEEWYRTLNGYVDGNPYYTDSDLIEDLRDEVYSYLRG